jgi:thiosulfate/3-mercaptopyruvate sulfurtransferase
MTPPAPFVDVASLAARLGDPALLIVDGSWHLPTSGRSAAAEFAERRIPGAVFLDIDAVADRASGLPHIMPGVEAFAQWSRLAGLGAGMAVVVYDALGLFAAARVRFMLRHFGVGDVRILDGGFPAWLAAGGAVETGPPRPRPPGGFVPVASSGAIARLEDVRAALREGVQVIDARPAPRFLGEAPEPRPGLAMGHMPGALNVPFDRLIADGRLKDADGLRAALAAAGADPDAPAVTTCGSGVSAAIVGLALEVIGNDAWRLYDGSWAEWGARADLPVAKV